LARPQFLDLALQFLQCDRAPLLVVTPSRMPVSISKRLRTHSLSGLGHAADLGRDQLNGSPQGRVFATVLLHHAYSAFAHFR
jgi:hypothetical protein